MVGRLHGKVRMMSSYLEHRSLRVFGRFLLIMWHVSEWSPYCPLHGLILFASALLMLGDFLVRIGMRLQYVEMVTPHEAGKHARKTFGTPRAGFELHWSKISAQDACNLCAVTAGQPCSLDWARHKKHCTSCRLQFLGSLYEAGRR